MLKERIWYQIFNPWYWNKKIRIHWSNILNYTSINKKSIEFYNHFCYTLFMEFNKVRLIQSSERHLIPARISASSAPEFASLGRAETAASVLNLNCSSSASFQRRKKQRQKKKPPPPWPWNSNPSRNPKRSPTSGRTTIQRKAHQTNWKSTSTSYIIVFNQQPLKNGWRILWKLEKFSNLQEMM